MAEELVSWTINYLPEAGGARLAPLTVSDGDVRFDALYDSCNATILEGIVGSLGTIGRPRFPRTIRALIRSSPSGPCKIRPTRFTYL